MIDILRDIATEHGGAETATRKFQFDRLEDAIPVIEKFGVWRPPPVLLGRLAELSASRGRLVVDVRREAGDKFAGLAERRGWLQKVVDVPQEPVSLDFVRRVRQPDQSCEWFTEPFDGTWSRASASDVKLLLMYKLGCPKRDAEKIMGSLIDDPWTQVWEPFKPEYPEPDKRIWNRSAPLLKVEPKAGSHPHWDKLFKHLGRGLNAALKVDPWAIEHGVDGPGYLKLWLASVIQAPREPLPMLFLFGGQDAGKSTLHEAIDECLFSAGVVSGDRALKAQHNGELLGGVLAYIEEVDINDRRAYARLKDWVTAKTLRIRRMRTDAFRAPNTLHWMMCANARSDCPAILGDTRITFVEVPDLLPDETIPKSILFPRLKEEAPAIAHTLETMKLPTVEGRLHIPMIETESKRQATYDQLPELVRSIIEHRQPFDGTAKELADLFHLSISGRKVHAVLKDHAKAFTDHGVIIETGARGPHGVPIIVDYADA